MNLDKRSNRTYQPQFNLSHYRNNFCYQGINPGKLCAPLQPVANTLQWHRA